MPLMKYLNILGTARISFGIYNTNNTKKDVYAAVVAIDKVKHIFQYERSTVI